MDIHTLGTGIWLIHSVPHYPPYPNQTNGDPHTGRRYLAYPFSSSLSTLSKPNIWIATHRAQVFGLFIQFLIIHLIQTKQMEIHTLAAFPKIISKLKVEFKNFNFKLIFSDMDKA